jgi:hypothetical protein
VTAVEIVFRDDGLAALRIPPGHKEGDFIVLQMNRALVDREVLEALVREYHEMDEHEQCYCGWVGAENGPNRVTHPLHVEHEVREALAGRAKL